MKYTNFKLNELMNIGPIGPICDLKNMANVSGLNNCQQKLEEMTKEIELWRMILGDGNCFYRAFMFAYIESIILGKNIIGIKKFIYDFNLKMDVSFKRKNISINKYHFLAIFNIIVDFLERNDVKGAYEIFIKSYHLFENFDLGLVKYMRVALSKFIDQNKNCFYDSESKIKICNLLPSAYIHDNTFNFEGFYNEFLLSMHNEAEKIIIYISPIAFNINLDLHVLEGVDNNEIGTKYFKHHFPSSSPFYPTVSLFYRFSHYDKFYSKEMMELYKDILINDNKEQNIDLENRIISLGIVPCERCKSETELIQFVILQYADCKQCIIKFIHELITKRIKNYINESYNNLECIENIKVRLLSTN